jgi:hypothetical protein
MVCPQPNRQRQVPRDACPVSCDCDDYTLRREACKHVIAARLVQERDHGGASPAIDTSEVLTRPTYSQAWPAYNKGPARGKAPLSGSARGVEQRRHRPLRTGVGRKPIPLADRLFPSVFKVYPTVSSRGFNCGLEDATERGYLTRVSQHFHVSRLHDSRFAPPHSHLSIFPSLPFSHSGLAEGPDLALRCNRPPSKPTLRIGRRELRTQPYRDTLQSGAVLAPVRYRARDHPSGRFRRGRLSGSAASGSSGQACFG